MSDMSSRATMTMENRGMDMPTYIKRDAIKRLFATNGFKLVTLQSGPAFVYSSRSGFSMEFPVKWLSSDNGRDYELMQVRHVLNHMTASAKREERIFDFMRDKKKMDELFLAAKDFGMTYDADNKMLICKKTRHSRTALYTVELDYIVALKLENCKDMSYKEIFEALKDSAEQDKKEKNGGEVQK